MEKDKKSAQILYYDLYGKREEKYNFLLENDLQTVEWKELQPQEPYYFFVPKDFSLQEEYEKGFKIDELFNLNGVGICSKRDGFTIHETKEKLINTIKEFVSLNDKEARSRFNLGKDTDWKLSEAKKDLTNNPDFSKITKLNYRPFDIRYTYHSNIKGFHARPVYNIMQHFTKGENIGLVVSRQCDSDWRYIFITKNITDLNLIATAAKFGGGYIFPLYRYIESFGSMEKEANLNKETVTRFQNSLQLTAPPTPEQIFDYVYAVLHSPAYRERYREFLKIDFPRVPYPENTEQFLKLVELGGKLRRLHLMEGVEPKSGMSDFPVAGSNEVEKPHFVCHSAPDAESPANNKIAGQARNDDRVYINETQYFDCVPPEAWNFYIGGYQPAQKWLKDRKGQTLGYENIVHYQMIIRVLMEAGEVMREVDEMIGSMSFILFEEIG